MQSRPFVTKRCTRALAVMAPLAFSASLLHCGGDSFTVAADAGSDAALPDGSVQDTSVQDASTTDVAGDGSDDAPPIPDAGRPDAVGSDASPAPFSCGSPPAGTLFCADFDTVGDVKDNWDNEIKFGGGDVGFDVVNFVSPPKGMAASHGIAGGAVSASLQKTVTSAATVLDFGFSMRVKTLDTTNNATITAARLAVGDAHDLFLDFQIDRNGARLHQGLPGADAAGEETDPVSASIPANKWVRIRIALDRGPTPAVRVYVDDIKIIDRPPITSTIKSSKAEIDLGMIFVQSPSTGNAIAYDNVLLRGL